MTATPRAFAFRTERQRPGSKEWVGDRRVTLMLAPGEAVALSQLGWRDRDGAEATVDFDGGMDRFLGVRLDPDGTSYAWRGLRDSEPPERPPYRFRALRPQGAGELRVLIEDGGAPVVRICWTDRSGGGGAVTLHTRDLDGGELTAQIRAVEASGEHPAAGEVAENVLDRTSSKWLTVRGRGGDWLRFTLLRPVTVRHYVLSSANDAPDRDPRSWILKGSADGRTWVTLDIRTEEFFPGRHMERGFDITERAGSEPYRYLRLEIVGNSGSPHTQLSQVRFHATGPVPVSFTGHHRRAGQAPVPYEGVAGEPGSVRLDTVERWRPYLAEYSRDMLRVAADGELADITPRQRDASWLGRPGASEEQLVALEKRLGSVLPPSYRSFLATSDGWRNISLFMAELRDTATVGLLRDAEPDTWEILRGEDDEDADDREFMDRVVLVSGQGDAQYWLLDPADVSPDGEWAAHIWASWYPGLGERFASFAELIAEERASFERIRGQEGRPVRPEGAEEHLALGRDAALRGEVDVALSAFGTAAEKGSGAAAYLKVILSAFLDSRFTHHELRGVLHRPHVVAAIGREQIRAEAVPLFLRCAAADRPGAAGWAARVLGDFLPDLPGLPLTATGAAIGPAWEEWATRYQAPPLPEPPAFQQALDTARLLASRGSGDEAWTVIELALPAWQAASPHRIAPVVLLTDPVLAPVMTPRRARAVVFTARGAQQA
ncbi:SMI1/KNR4 family protein [Streptomyces sp. NBC_01497]|uniref:SMI1/KNR4 family protein n=1 Tax=Streptomyces sp. NBC_01497 TaxID=2903885 RepID=UPI002E2FBA71|nr:SMI1/KNR4 family protein [Streptomyces sp. NBC_01497]